MSTNTTKASAASMKNAPMRRPMTAVGSVGGAPGYAYAVIRPSLSHANGRIGPIGPPVSTSSVQRMSQEVAADPALFDKVVNLCKRRGFVFPSAEIYGGFRSTYDYGPLGSLMLRNVKDAWLRSMVQMRIDVVGLDASILSPPAVWEASGHLKNFSDPLVDCKNCGARHREDQLEDPNTCPSCGGKGTFTEARQFNLM